MLEKMSSAPALLKHAFGAASLLAAGSAFAAVDSVGGPAVHQLNLHAPVTQIAREIYSLHTLMMIICVVIFVAVFGVMFYSVFKHRKSKGAVADKWHESTSVEIAWTVVPFLIVILMALPATKTVVAMKDTSNSDITIKAIGQQWKWGYEYVVGEGEGIGFYSNLSTPREQISGASTARAQNANYLIEVDNPLVVPVNKKIRVLTTASDVIHAWMVPSFGVKQDAIPGFVRSTWFKADVIGEYRGQCAELCGKEHAFMPIVVKVVSAEDYTKWVEGKKKELAAKADDPNKVWTIDELKTRGEKVYTANCAACHQANGKGIPNAFPALEGSAKVLGARAVQLDILLNGVMKDGKPSAMVSFAKTLNDTEIASVITYTRNSWGNKAAENIVQPSEVAAARKK